MGSTGPERQPAAATGKRTRERGRDKKLLGGQHTDQADETPGSRAEEPPRSSQAFSGVWGCFKEA